MKNRRLFPILITALFFAACNSTNDNTQENVTDIISVKTDSVVEESPYVQVPEEDLSQFVPKGYEVYDTYNADLNLDTLIDKLVMLGIDRSLDSVALSKIFPDTFNFNMRPLLIIIRQPDSTLKQVVRNDYAIESDGCWVGGPSDPDPLNSIDVDRGQFNLSFNYKGGGEICGIDVLFKYSEKKQNWFLSKMSHVCNSSFSNDSGSFDESYRKIKTTKDFGQVLFKNYKGKDLYLKD